MVDTGADLLFIPLGFAVLIGLGILTFYFKKKNTLLKSFLMSIISVAIFALGISWLLVIITHDFDIYNPLIILPICIILPFSFHIGVMYLFLKKEIQNPLKQAFIITLTSTGVLLASLIIGLFITAMIPIIYGLLFK